MTAIEAMAAGTPVIAYREGGALDFIKEGVSGIFFDKPNPDSLAHALETFMQVEASFSRESLRDFSNQFNEASFQGQFEIEIAKLIEGTPN